MRGLVGLLIVVVIAGFAVWFYLTRATPAGTQGTPVQVISGSQAQSALLQIAQAERSYFVDRSTYAPLEELISTGRLTEQATKCPGYSFSIDVSLTAFTATARCEPAPGQACTSFAVDQTMNIRAVP